MSSPAEPHQTPGRSGGRFVSAAVLLCVLSQGITACSAPLEQAAATAVNQAASAVGTGALSLDLLANERTGTPVVETSLEDMAEELETARKEFHARVPATADERRLHSEVDPALERAQSALSLARQVLASKDTTPGPENPPSLSDVRAALARSAKELDTLRQRLGTGR